MFAFLVILLGYASAWNNEYTLDDNRSLNTMTEFKSWSIAFNRSYASLEEESSKYLIWVDNLYKIAETNSQSLSYKLRLNQFSDMTPDQFRHYIHGDDGACFKGGKYKLMNNNNPKSKGDNPASVDWTTKGVVTPVKNQGSCGMSMTLSPHFHTIKLFTK